MVEVQTYPILGNNWSYGFLQQIPSQKINSQNQNSHRQFSHLKDNKILESYVEENNRIRQFVMDRVRKQLEMVDCAMAIHVIASLGGGTGSGVGTKMVELLNQEFNIDVFSHCVLPNMSGQTPLQIYNCSLALSVLQQNSRAIFPIQNDKKLQYFRLYSSQYFLTQSLSLINQQIAYTINSLISLNELPSHPQFYTDHISSHLISPQLKYLSLLSSSSSSKLNQSEECFNELLEQLKIFNMDFLGQEQRRERLISGELMLMGYQQFDFQRKFKKKFTTALNTQQQDMFNYHLIQQKPININTNDKKNKKQQEKTNALMIINHTNITRYLNYLCQKGTIKFKNKAYLWHYQYVDLEQAFQNIQKTIDQYNYLAFGNI